MKNTHKLISILLVIAMMLTMAPIAVFTASAEIVDSGEVGTISYTIDDNNVMTISGTGSVSRISNLTTKQSNSILRVVIEEGITGIEQNGLSNLYKLESVSIPASVTSIGATAFYAYAPIKSITYWGTRSFTATNVLGSSQSPAIYVKSNYSSSKMFGKSVTKILTDTSKECNVDFIMNGYGEQVKSQYIFNISDYNKVTKPTDPTAPEVKFEGWYKDSALTIPWDFDSDTVSGDTIIYAKWNTSADHTVSFDMGSYGTAISNRGVVDGTLVKEPDAPNDDNAIFLGWYKDNTFETAWDFSSDTVTTNTTLYAKWRAVDGKKPAYGDGTESNPFEIGTADELYWFADQYNNSNKFSEAYAVLVADITVNKNVLNADGTLNGDGSAFKIWQPIGSNTKQYLGIFDGQGHTISGLYFNNTDTTEGKYVGFIGYLGKSGTKATVKNLEIADSYFKGYQSVGGIVGSGYSNTFSFIENCKSSATVYAQYRYAGGISGNYGTIKNCLFVGKVGAPSKSYLGAILGSYQYENLENCYYLKNSAVCDGGKVQYGVGTNASDSNSNGNNVNYFAVTKAQLASGEVAYKLQGAQEDDSIVVWGQQLTGGNTNAYPVLNGPRVVLDTATGTYINSEEGSSHSRVRGYCCDKDYDEPVLVDESNYASLGLDSSYVGYYAISNYGQLYGFAKIVNGGDYDANAVLTANIVANENVLNSNGNLNGNGNNLWKWNPILPAGEVESSSPKVYSGIFDGNNKTISGLYYNNSVGAVRGLFGYVGENGVVKNLGIVDSYFYGQRVVGAIAGYNYGKITNCYSEITIKVYAKASTGMMNDSGLLGGIVGYNTGTIENCYNAGYVSGGSIALRVGGIAGLSTGSIDNCYNLGKVVGDGTVGGIVGSLYDATVSNCYNTGYISGRTNLGGIAGSASNNNGVTPTVKECWNSGTVFSDYSTNDSRYAGGIVGSQSGQYLLIKDCYNVGTISTAGLREVGGIVGYACYDAVVETSYNYGDAIGKIYVGAVVGRIGVISGSVVNDDDITITNCYYLEECAVDSNETVQNGVGNETAGSTTADVTGEAKALTLKQMTSNADWKTNFAEFDTTNVWSKDTNTPTVWYLPKLDSNSPSVAAPHTHAFVYTVNGNVITATCSNEEGSCPDTNGGTMTVKVPEDLLFSGKSKDIECTYTNWVPAKPDVIYNDVDRVNVTGRDIEASIVLGQGADAQTAMFNYQITPRELIDSMVTLSPSSTSYNGSEKTVTVTVNYDSSTTLVSGADYEVSGVASATDVGTYTVTVLGKGNYSGTIEKTWEITKATLSASLILSNWTYLDTPILPKLSPNPENAAVTYTFYIDARGRNKTGEDHGAETDGGVPTYAGTYYVGAVVAETENYKGATIRPMSNRFTIAPREINNPTFEGLQATYVYDNGNEIKPTFTVKDDLGNVIPESEYTVTYSDNTDLGEATITITDNADGNYNVSGTAKFTIIAHQHDWSYTANGNVITATCSNSDGGCPDTNGGTLTISAPADLYADGITAKEATVENNLVDTSVAVGDITYSSGSAPKTAGTYTASVTVGGATANVEYTLIKRNAAADMFVYTAPANLVYDGTSKYAAVDVSPEITGMGDITVTYYKDGVEAEPVDAGTYTVKVSTAESDKYYALTDVELGSFTIDAKDISDGFIILGDTLTYNGTEQIQTVEKVLTTNNLEATYTVSDNKATNVGIYLLTVTGTGNFKGEAKIAYEIAVDASGIDGITPLNVKSSDKAKIEYVYNQLDNAVTDLADDAKKAEWDNLKSDCVELLKMIESVADKLEGFKNKLAGYDIDTVTSDDADDLDSFYNDEVAQVYNDYFDNLTEAETKEFDNILSGISALQKRISDVAKEITRITKAVNGYDKTTVKSSDKADLEQLLADINTLTTGKNITDTERADLLALADTVNELLAVISDTSDEIKRITDAVNAYDIDTVTGDDVPALAQLADDVEALLDTDNLTEAEREALVQLGKDIQTFISRYDRVSAQIDDIKERMNRYNEATVKSSDKDDIEQLIADIKNLTDGQNLTAGEREYLINADAECDKLLAKIAETKSEYERLLEAANGYDEATVTSDDVADLEKLNEDIYALALTENVTAEEKENLQAAHDKVFALIDKLVGISDEIKRITEKVDAYVFESVKSSDKADIQQLIADIKALLDTQNITADERTILETADETCDKLIAKIDETVAEVTRIDEATNAYDPATVTSADKSDIEKLIADIKALTDGDNITDAEREQLVADDETLDELLEKINATAEEIARIEEAVNGYDEETVKSTDKADLEQLKADIKALTDTQNITEDERTKLGNLDATLDSLIKKIDDTAAEIARIEEAVNGYDAETVTSADVPALGKLIDDIKALTDGGNLTDDEKAVLEANDESIDELVAKLTEVAEEIKRVDETVKSYDEATVKSTDKADLEQLKEDIQALIDSTNTTENEKTALVEMLEKVNALLDKISETEEKLEEIKGIENNFNPENVSSDDKAAIEEKIAEIEAVNPDNLTEEQKAEYDEIKAGFEALLEEIEKAGSEVDAIGSELEMFDEERVTIFYEDEIEALKAKIDELLADENMGEAEKAKLNEYKAQCEKLIEIINNPCDYFSMRLFHFVWDALHWLSSHVVFIFNWIVSML